MSDRTGRNYLEIDDGKSLRSRPSPCWIMNRSCKADQCLRKSKPERMIAVLGV